MRWYDPRKDKGNPSNMPSAWWVLTVSASVTLLVCALWFGLEHLAH